MFVRKFLCFRSEHEENKSSASIERKISSIGNILSLRMHWKLFVSVKLGLTKLSPIKIQGVDWTRSFLLINLVYGLINITNVIFKLNLVSAHSKYKKKNFWFALSVYQRFFLILNYLYIVTLLLLHSFFSYISYIKSFNITCIKNSIGCIILLF